ncbi:hypothetical protein A1O3_06118 [Capronia epimyces CBS 606.96]|uniref:DUF7924 domain-containing protein n=1 Tax=Capronia epimyces CBS 606.96 TaxID=1182542 RepID=W9XY40_9EURO|nr:uncharacterized protein A1O3_06118 [Capronia epimyces CBS 606.96]EXJ82305.1 hypothetical protein A1O3_06118 [Capronia epimyces CBS 606.96]
MATGAAELDPGRAWRGRGHADEPRVQPDCSSRKRQLSANGEDEDEDESTHDARRPRHAVARQAESVTEAGGDYFVEEWLAQCYPAGKSPAEIEAQLSGGPADTSRTRPPDLPDPESHCESTPTATSIHDLEYRRALRYRNIWIYREDPPEKLMWRAKRIISWNRESPEMDDEDVQQLVKNSRRLEEMGRDGIIEYLAKNILPSKTGMPHSKQLAWNSGKPWLNSVPLPLRPCAVHTNASPLREPKPNLVFGFSKEAFTENQLGVIDLLINDETGKSYAIPDQEIRFPFLEIEFKSQAKYGTHYTATNLTALAGAIMLNGHVNLMRRSFGIRDFDYDEPQYFSITMDHELARINVHWLRPTHDQRHSFHVEGLSKYLLDDPNSIRALSRAIKNILEYGAVTLHRRICRALNAYGGTGGRNLSTANIHKILEAQERKENSKCSENPGT